MTRTKHKRKWKNPPIRNSKILLIGFADLEIPAVARRSDTRFPVRQLTVGGNCMVIKGMSRHRMSRYLRYYREKYGMQFVTRTLKIEERVPTIGVWRTK